MPYTVRQFDKGSGIKTVVVYDKIRLQKSNHYDSLCSYVNITELTEPRIYRFKIYTEDNSARSIPQEIALVPYTSADVKVLKEGILLQPLLPERIGNGVAHEFTYSLDGISWSYL